MLVHCDSWRSYYRIDRSVAKNVSCILLQNVFKHKHLKWPYSQNQIDLLVHFYREYNAIKNFRRCATTTGSPPSHSFGLQSPMKDISISIFRHRSTSPQNVIAQMPSVTSVLFNNGSNKRNSPATMSVTYHNNNHPIGIYRALANISHCHSAYQICDACVYPLQICREFRKPKLSPVWGKHCRFGIYIGQIWLATQCEYYPIICS